MMMMKCGLSLVIICYPNRIRGYASMFKKKKKELFGQYS